MVFDLDPADNVTFDLVKEGALRVRDVLLALGLKSFPMLSGGKGIHVVVPLVPKHDWDVIKEFSGAVAARMAADQPERYLDTMTKAKRPGKIFIDFFRNDRTATAIAPYSARARTGAPLAWPIGWKDLAKFTAANQITMKNYKKFLKADPWPGATKLRQQIKPAAAAALGMQL
jgi:bifunctional non-homologous end joining protein LigD